MVTTTMSKIDPGLEYGLVSGNCPSQTKHGEMNVRCTNTIVPYDNFTVQEHTTLRPPAAHLLVVPQPAQGAKRLAT